jgi:hypothetical protein
VDDPAHVLPGYEYDVTDEDALLHRMVPLGSTLRTPEGIRYKALALPTSRTLTLEDLIWVKKFVHQGGAVIGLEPVSPQGLIPPAQMAEYKQIAATMWGNCGAGIGDGMVIYGAGRIYCTQNSHHVLELMRINPDFTYRSDEPNVAFDFVHRRTENAEIYFVRNENDSPAEATWIFRVKGRTPELFDVDTGKTAPALVYREDGEQTEVPLTIPALGSVFVIFERSASRHAVSVECDRRPVFPSSVPGIGVFGSAMPGSSLYAVQPGSYEVKYSDGTQQSIQVSAFTEQPQLHGQWTVAFPTGWGAPPSVTMTNLQSWTDSPVSGVRYFSGTATYHNVVQVPADLLDKNREIWMDLGDVREIATVAVNGKELRTLWHAPFLLRIDPALHAGDNELSIRVTNLWPNRLIGDQQPAEKAHYTKTNIHVYSKDSPLLPSGLLSPVTLRVTEKGRTQ